MTLQLSPYTQAALADGTRSFLAKRLLSKHPQPILQALASTPALLPHFRGQFTPELLLDAGPLHSPDIAALVESEHETFAASVFLPLPDALVGRVASFLDARTALRLPLLCHHAHALRCEVLCPLAHAVLEMTPCIDPAVAELFNEPRPPSDRDLFEDFAPNNLRPECCSVLVQLVDQTVSGPEHGGYRRSRWHRNYREDFEDREDDVPRPQSLQCLERLPMASIVRGTVVLATLSTLVMHMDEELLDVLQTSSFMDAAIKHITNLGQLMFSFDSRCRVPNFLSRLLHANSHSLESIVLMKGDDMELFNLDFPRLTNVQFMDCRDLRVQGVSWPKLSRLFLWDSWDIPVTHRRRLGRAGSRDQVEEQHQHLPEEGDGDSVNGIGASVAEVEGLQTVSLEYCRPETRQQLLSVLHSINRELSDRRRRLTDSDELPVDGPLWSPKGFVFISQVDPKAVACHLDLPDLLKWQRFEEARNEQKAALLPLWVDHHVGLLTEVLQNVAPHELQLELNPRKIVRTLQSFEAMCNFISRLPDILAAAVAKNPHLLPSIQPGTKPMPGQGLCELRIVHSACRAAEEGWEDAFSYPGSDESGSDIDVSFKGREESRYRIDRRITRQQKERAVEGVQERIADVLRDRYDMHMEYVHVLGSCTGDSDPLRRHMDVWRFSRYKAPTSKDVLAPPLSPPAAS